MNEQTIAEAIKAFLMAWPYLTFAVCLLLGAAYHYIQGRFFKKTVTSGFWEYWLFDNPMHSAGAIGAIGGIWLAAVATDALAGAQWTLITTGGLTAGFTLNSMINTTTPKPNP